MPIAEGRLASTSQYKVERWEEPLTPQTAKNLNMEPDNHGIWTGVLQVAPCSIIC